MMGAKIPNLETLVSGFNSGEEFNNEPEKLEHEQPSRHVSGDSSLWTSLIQELSQPKDKEKHDTKLYMIDSDIIETINLCDFKASNIRVINTILRLFLVSNLDRLEEIRKEIPKPISLFDKYSNPKS